MGNSIKIITLILLLSMSALASNQGMIKGTVFNADGVPLSNSKIVFYSAEMEAVDSVITDVTGVFSISLESDKYYISASAFNYTRMLYPNVYQFHNASLVELFAGQIKEISFNLIRGGIICGQIYTYNEEQEAFLVTAIKVSSPYAGWQNSQEYIISSHGDYCLDGLLPGYYKVLVNGQDYSSEYFPGVGNIDEADLVDVEQGSIANNVSFNMEQPNVGIVRGIVTSNDRSYLVEHAKVIAYQQRLPELDPYKVTTFTNSSGEYRFELLGGYYYICAMIGPGCVGDERIELYYNDKFSSEFATPVRVNPNGDVTGIDFEFDLSKDYGLKIYGALNNNLSGLPISGAKLAAVDYYTGEAISIAYSRYNGEFEIENLVSGTYIIEITGPGIVPSFWPDVYSWRQAETIELSNSNYIVYNGGAITQDYGTPEYEISGVVRGDGQFLENTRVYATNTEDNTIVYSATNSFGYYNLSSGLHSGEYKLYADKYGWNGSYYSSNIVLDSIASYEDINFELNMITLSIDETEITLPEQVGLIGNYPNPFNASTTIIMSFDESLNSQLEIYNLTGQLVNSIPFKAQPGINTIMWNGVAANGKNVSSGIYLYKVQSLPVVKKMVLVK